MNIYPFKHGIQQPFKFEKTVGGYGHFEVIVVYEKFYRELFTPYLSKGCLLSKRDVFPIYPLK